MFTVTPALSLVGPDGAFTARLNGTRFESGSGSLQSDVAGVIFVGRADRPLRAELTGTAGALWYRSGPPDAKDANVGLRVRAERRDRGLWLDGGGGLVTINDGDLSAVGRAGGGFWRREGRVLYEASFTGTAVGVREYGDAEAAVRWDLPRLGLELSGGRRLGERAAGVRQWTEVGATWWATRRIALVAAGGSYPADLSRGAPGGRYAALAARISTSRRYTWIERSALSRLARLRAYGPGDSAGPAAPAVELRAGQAGRRLLIVRLPGSDGAERAELMGNFTGWAPVPLARRSPGVWSIELDVAPGLHRFNVRIDGGEWTVPPGTSTDEDEFGGTAALLVVR